MKIFFIKEPDLSSLFKKRNYFKIYNDGNCEILFDQEQSFYTNAVNIKTLEVFTTFFNPFIHKVYTKYWNKVRENEVIDDDYTNYIKDTASSSFRDRENITEIVKKIILTIRKFPCKKLLKQ